MGIPPDWAPTARCGLGLSCAMLQGPNHDQEGATVRIRKVRLATTTTLCGGATHGENE